MTIEFLSAFGLGALITAVFQAFFNIYHNKKILSFQEKKEAYVGLLEAYHKVAVQNSLEAAKNFAYWQMRCELISNAKVRKSIQNVIDTESGSSERGAALESLKKFIREDLGIEGKKWSL